MKKILYVFLLVALSFAAQAQGEKNSLKGVPLSERIVTGGGLGLSFGSYQDYFSVSPLIGYRLTAKLTAGVQLTYRYTNYKYYKPSIKLNDYGVSPYLQYFVYKNVFVQTEYQYLNYEFPVNTTESVRRGFNSFLAGGGFMQPLGSKAGFYIMALYNFSYTNPQNGQYAPYASPWVIRAGVNLGALSF